MTLDTYPTIAETESSYHYALELVHSGRYHDAEKILENLCEFSPDNETYQLALANSLHLQKDYNRAISLYDELIGKQNSSASAWNNRGVSLLAAARHPEAIHSFLHALQLSPELQQTKVALASCYHALGLFEQSISCCNEVLSVNPENAEAHWNKSLLLLLDGKYDEGWQEYEWRWKKEGFTSPVRSFNQPRWNGEPTQGKVILVYAEQGFGDTLQFCRYIPLLEKCGVSVVFECHRELATLAQSLSPALTVIPFGEKLPYFDFHIPLLSLPALFNTSLETIPDTTPYLTAPTDYKNRFNLPDNKQRRKIGLCWAGKTYPDPARSCPVEQLQRFATITNIDWYSLQIGWDKELPLKMFDLTSQIADFADTAALMENLDLIITIDTSVAHLAGALGKTTWVLLPFVSDWRWMKERSDSPWYPDMKLFRQPIPNLWDNPVNAICNSLKMLPPA